jgi:AraC-like DNA-binding protein
MLQDICRLASENPEGARDAALWLVALLVSRGFSQSARVRGGLAPWQMRKIEQHLREHLQHPIRVYELAQLLSLSVSYFCRAFKQTFGTSPHEYIIQLRLARARELMLTMTDPLGQIVLDCGFGDQAHLMMAVASLSSRQGFLASSAAIALPGMFRMASLAGEINKVRPFRFDAPRPRWWRPIQEISYVGRCRSYHCC